VATSRPGNSRNSFQKRFARASGPYTIDHQSRYGPQFTFSVLRPLLVACTHISGQVIEMSRGGSTNSSPRVSSAQKKARYALPLP
jgi:hypothetical protein